MFTENQLTEIKSLLQPNKNVVIITHYNPDGDAIGSSLGLKHFLKNLGVDATVIVPNDFPKFLKWMPEAKKIVIAEYKRKIVDHLVSGLRPATSRPYQTRFPYASPIRLSSLLNVSR